MAWNASNQANFEDRLHGVSRAMQDVRDEIQRLAEIFVEESVSGSGFFVGDKVTTGEMTNFVTLGSDFMKFFENQAVSTANRVSVLTPFLANR